MRLGISPRMRVKKLTQLPFRCHPSTLIWMPEVRFRLRRRQTSGMTPQRLWYFTKFSKDWLEKGIRGAYCRYAWVVQNLLAIIVEGLYIKNAICLYHGHTISKCGKIGCIIYSKVKM